MRRILIVGDVTAIALVTLIGFASHGELAISFATRMLTTFIPVVVAWFALAPFQGLFSSKITAEVRQLWRVLLVGIYAGPMAALIRAFMLDSAIVPIFVLVLCGTTALGMLIWRGCAWFIWSRRTASVEMRQNVE